jgi:hypothetical protein
MIGITFNLERPDARAKIKDLGLQYRAVLAGKQSLTDEQIDKLFDADLNAAISHARERITSFDTLSHSRQLVVVDLVFSLGPAAFDELEKAIAAINVDDWNTAAHEMQASAWFDQTGRHAGAIVGMMERGNWAAGVGAPSSGPGAPMAFGGSGGGGDPVTPEERKELMSQVTSDPDVKLKQLEDPAKTKPNLIRMAEKIVNSEDTGGLNYKIHISSIWRDSPDTGPYGGHHEGLAIDVNKIAGVHVGNDPPTKAFVLDIIQHNPYVSAILTPIAGIYKDPELQAAAKAANVHLGKDPSKAPHIHLRAKNKD